MIRKRNKKKKEGKKERKRKKEKKEKTRETNEAQTRFVVLANLLGCHQIPQPKRTTFAAKKGKVIPSGH
jgi:hypothetical protein